jgi:hypothetical protein
MGSAVLVMALPGHPSSVRAASQPHTCVRKAITYNTEHMSSPYLNPPPNNSLLQLCSAAPSLRYLPTYPRIYNISYTPYTSYSHLHTSPAVNLSKYCVLHRLASIVARALSSLHSIHIPLQSPDPRSVLNFNSTRLDAASDIGRIMSPTEGRTAFPQLLHASRSQ